MDHFDEKRGMVKQLLDMLKKHASDEVSNGLQHPEGEGDMHGIQAEKVEVLPEHEMDESTPEHDVVTHDMHTGGVVDKVSPITPLTMPSKQGNPDMKASAEEESNEPLMTREAATTEERGEPEGTKYPEAASEPSSMFQSFLSRKKKK